MRGNMPKEELGIKIEPELMKAGDFLKMCRELLAESLFGITLIKEEEKDEKPKKRGKLWW